MEKNPLAQELVASGIFVKEPVRVVLKIGLLKTVLRSSSTNHSSQKEETTQISTNQIMDK